MYKYRIKQREYPRGIKYTPQYKKCLFGVIGTWKDIPSRYHMYDYGYLYDDFEKCKEVIDNHKHWMIQIDKSNKEYDRHQKEIKYFDIK